MICCRERIDVLVYVGKVVFVVVIVVFILVVVVFGYREMISFVV